MAGVKVCSPHFELFSKQVISQKSFIGCSFYTKHNSLNAVFIISFRDINMAVPTKYETKD